MRVELLATELVVAEKFAPRRVKVEDAAISPRAIDLSGVRLCHVFIV
jgi:hypothetical protein